MKWYCYNTGIIDDFSLVLGFADYVKVSGKSMDDIIKMVVEASYYLAKSGLWEGNLREKLYVYPIYPANEDYGNFRVGFIFKQDNNGSTFLVSPIPLSIKDNK